MDRRTLDQTASERLLHRVLYAIKFLRAMVLHVSLAALAATRLRDHRRHRPVSGRRQHDPRLRAVAIQQKLQGNPLGGAAFWIVAALVIAAAIAALVWVYRSITDVRPKSLRVQAVVIVAVASWNVAGLRDELQFAFDRLDPTFAVIAALGVGLSLFVFPVSVAVSLWQVSRAPERSSLIATLDPRLAPSAWTYWNKLLDLPRTPLRTGKTLAAYSLAVAGALLLVMSMMYLLTLGGVGNRLEHAVDRLRHPDLAPMSRPVVDLGLADPARAAAVGGRRQGRGAAAVAGQAPRRTERLRRAQAPRRPVPALPATLRQRRCRPADTAPAAAEPPVFVPSSRGPGRRGAVRRRRRLPAADRGRQARRRPRDAGRSGVSRLSRRLRVAGLRRRQDPARRANRPRDEGQRGRALGDRPRRRRRRGAEDAVPVRPDAERRGRARDAGAHARAAARRASAPRRGFAFSAATIGFYFHGGALVEIVNQNRTATSYRTAFSHFLAET